MGMNRVRFPGPVRVGRQVDGVDMLGGLPQLLNQLPFALDDFINRLEIIVNIDGQVLLREILHMAERRLHHVFLAEVLPDRFRLRRRFDDDEVFCHMSAMNFPGARPPLRTTEILP